MHSEEWSPASPSNSPTGTERRRVRKSRTSDSTMDEKFSDFEKAMKSPLTSALQDKVSSEEMDTIMHNLFKRVPDWMKAQSKMAAGSHVAFFPVLMNDEQMRKYQKLFENDQ